MGPPERPDQPSIFSRPDPDVDRFEPQNPAPPADPILPEIDEAPDWDSLRLPPPNRDALPAAEGAVRSRTVLIAGGVAGIAILGLAGFIVASVLGDGGAAGLGSPTPSPSPSDAPILNSGEASASPSAEETASPSASPFLALPLTGGQWATVTTDILNVRTAPTLDAPIVGSVNNGEIVFIPDDETQVSDGLTWYRGLSAPGVAGWMAAHSDADQNITPDEPTTSVRWCAVPDLAVFVINGPGQVVLGNNPTIGGLSIAADLFGAGGLGIVELAWGTQDRICLDITIRDGANAAVGLSVELNGCAHPFGGSPAMAVFGSGAVGPDGVADSRTVVLDASVIGYDPFTAGARPNLADVLMMASIGNMGEPSGEVCFTGSAGGSAKSPQIQLNGATTQCAWLSSLTATGATLHHPEEYWVAELRLTQNSHVGSGVTQQNNRYDALKGFRISADAGLDADAGLSVRDVPGCND